MSRVKQVRSTEQAILILTGIIVGVAVFVALYWAQKVLIPVALAMYLAFLLSPIVMQFQRWGLHRVPAVLAVTLLTSALVLGIGYVVVSQIAGLMIDLPNYTGTIKKKVEAFQAMGENSEWQRLQAMAQDIGSAFLPKQPAPSANGSLNTNSGQPVPVVIDQAEPLWVRWVPGYIGTVLEFFGELGLVIVLAIFMMLAREDLRNRFLRIVGAGHMTVTTKAVDDASQRLSRFLLRQLLLNASFGLLVGVGLALLGVEYALLWGFVGMMMRYLPYIGSPLAAVFPALLSVAQFEGWIVPIMVVVLILGLELVYANVAEPWVYGQSIGVSAVALLVAAAFWTFLWGPVGLVLSCPLTVCVVVLGKYVPCLQFLNVLLGDQPALDEPSTYYQRLQARDKEEALLIVRSQLKTNPPETVYDTLLMSGLINAARDKQRGGLEEKDVEFVQEATVAGAEVVDDACREQQGKKQPTEQATTPLSKRSPVLILGVSVRDHNDELALKMLQQLLQYENCELDTVAPEVLASELLEIVQKKEPAAVCLAALPPGGLEQARFLCKRLRKRFPRLQIMVGRWGLKSAVEHQRQILRDAGANQVKTTVVETRDELLAWLPALADHPGKTASVEEKRPDQQRVKPVAQGLR